MQLYVSVQPDLPDGGPYAQMNPGSGEPFGVIEFGDNAYVSVKSDDEARRIIAAAACLIEMRQWIGRPHAYERGGAASVVSGSTCVRCGMLGNSPDHAKPEPAEPEPETVPWPTGLCGHTVTPGAWSQGYHVCRDCLTDWDRQEAQARYDRATAGEQLDQAAS